MSRGRFDPSSLPVTTPQPSTTMVQSSSVPTSIETAAPTSTASVSFPPCAASCLADATSTLPCEEWDSQCLCLHASTVSSSVDTCLTASGECSATDKTSATLYYDSLCQSLGYATDSNSTDLPTAALVTATGSPSATSSITPTAQVASAPSQSSANTNSHGLSVGAVAGIAVACALLVVGIITALVLLYLRRRSRPQIVIVDSEKKSPFDSSRPTTAQTRPKSSGRQSALFTLEGPSPPRKENPFRDSARTLNSPTTNFTNKSFTWYNKKEAELSTTTLMTASRNLITPIPQSPAVTEFSDQASVYSASASDLSDAETRRTDDEASRPMSYRPESDAATPLRSQRGSRVIASQYMFSPPPVSFSQPRPGTAQSQAERPKLGISTQVQEIELDDVKSVEDIRDDGKSDRRITLNPLGQNPSPTSNRNSMAFSLGRNSMAFNSRRGSMLNPNRDSAAFNFALPSPSSTTGFGDSFLNMGDFDKWKDRK